MDQFLEFATRHAWIVAGLVTSALAVMFYELRMRTAGATHVSTADAVRLINKGALVIDVRKPEEYAAGHIVNARNLALEKLRESQDALGKKKDKILITVCDHGAAAGAAAGLLRKAGYQNAFSLKGGLSSWRADNLPLVK